MLAYIAFGLLVVVGIITNSYTINALIGLAEKLRGHEARIQALEARTAGRRQTDSKD